MPPAPSRHRVLPTLHKRHLPLAAADGQRALLAGVPVARSFEAALGEAGLYPLRATGIDILQINVGRKCNQTCRHCHVDAGPDRTEMMPDAVVDRVIDIIESTDIPTVDITGGAPELHRRWKRDRRAGAARGQARDGPLQPHHHAAAQLRVPPRVLRGARGARGGVAAALPGEGDGHAARRRACSRSPSRRCGR